MAKTVRNDRGNYSDYMSLNVAINRHQEMTVGIITVIMIVTMKMTVTMTVACHAHDP